MAGEGGVVHMNKELLHFGVIQDHITTQRQVN